MTHCLTRWCNGAMVHFNFRTNLHHRSWRVRQEKEFLYYYIYVYIIYIIIYIIYKVNLTTVPYHLILHFAPMHHCTIVG